MLPFTILNGLTLAALLFVTASGLTLSFSLMRVINLTHGAFYLIGGYIGMSIGNATGTWLPAVIVAGIGVAALALVEERWLLRRARGQPLIETLITLSVAIILGDLALVIWGGTPRTIDVPTYLSGVTMLPFVDFPYPTYRLFILAFGAVLAFGLWLMMHRTRLGITLRAGVDNFQMVAALGINVSRLFTLTFALSGFLAGIAGVMGGTFLMLGPGEDFRILTLTLVVIIIGGLGSLGGTLAGALITGLLYSFASAYVSQFALVIMFLPVALILAVRPHGLFGVQTQ